MMMYVKQHDNSSFLYRVNAIQKGLFDLSLGFWAWGDDVMTDGGDKGPAVGVFLDLL